MTTRLNSTETGIKPGAEPARKKAVEFVMVDKKTQRGYLTFYHIDEPTADAIIAAANVILRNSEHVHRNDA